MLQEKEIWKDIKGYEGYYQVSNKGNIRSLDRIINYTLGKGIKKGQNIIATADKKGYLRVNLTKDRKGKTHKVHRLVAEAFIPNPNNYPQVNHKDENKANNNVDNLEWCTNKYNVNYGHCRDNNRKKIICITTGMEFDSIKEAKEFYGIKDKRNLTINWCGKLPDGTKLKWKYKDNTELND